MVDFDELYDSITNDQRNTFSPNKEYNMQDYLSEYSGENSVDNPIHIAQLAGQKYGIDPKLIMSVMKQESGFKNGLTSSAGAKGYMQLMPDTARALGVTDVNDPVQNIMAGTKYLREQLDRYGDVSLALAAYNAGPGNVNKYKGIPPFKETINYVNKIMNSYNS
jgi:soluble lytic murein transglycosylase-like protein